MAEYSKTLRQFSKYFSKAFIPSNQRITYRLNSINEIPELDKANNYDLIILDRDCTLQGYHGKSRVAEFEDTLKIIGPKSEIVSNSSFDEMRRIRDVYGELMPISAVVMFEKSLWPHILRFENGVLKAYKFNNSSNKGIHIRDAPHLISGDKGKEKLVYDVKSIKKPNPLVLEAVVALSQHFNRIGDNPHILMVGDRYCTDMMCANLADKEGFARFDTALVKPYEPGSETIALKIGRYLFDAPVGGIVSRLNHKSNK